MLRIILISILLFPQVLIGQTFGLFGNEWVQDSQSYFKFYISENGIYKLSFDNLEAAGIPLDEINPRYLKIFHNGKEIPIYCDGEADQIFDKQDFVLFYGKYNDGTLDKALYTHKNLLCVLCNSRFGFSHLQLRFPSLKVFYIPQSINAHFFSPPKHKEKILAFMSRKREDDLKQVLQNLHANGHLMGWEIIDIEGVGPEEVAGVMKKSKIFLSSASREGFGLPAAEAMACGCIVVGYHGIGGKEYFNAKIGFPIEENDLIDFLTTSTEVVQNINKDFTCYDDLSRLAAKEIKEKYSVERESELIISSFSEVSMELLSLDNRQNQS